MTLAVNIAQGGSNNVTFRNRIINGAMVIDQRNAGASVTPTTSATYTLDRWYTVNSVTSKYSVQQNAGSVTLPTGFTNYLGCTSLAATSVGSGDYYHLSQAIEGFNVGDLAWGTANAKTVTLSFQVYSSLTGTFGGALRNSATNRSYPFSFSVSSANTWTSISITIAGDTTGTWLTTNGTGILLTFSLGTGSTYSATAGSWQAGNYANATGATNVVATNGATFYITGVQLEAGSAASPFENRLYGTELALCQRYYYKIQNDGSGDDVAVGFGAQQSSTVGMYVINYAVTMRSEPTATISSLQATDLRSWSATATFSSFSAGYNTATLLATFASNGSTGAAVFLKIIQNTSGYVALSAEL